MNPALRCSKVATIAIKVMSTIVLIVSKSIIVAHFPLPQIILTSSFFVLSQWPEDVREADKVAFRFLSPLDSFTSLIHARSALSIPSKLGRNSHLLPLFCLEIRNNHLERST
jgi:hypothetical protein